MGHKIDQLLEFHDTYVKFTFMWWHYSSQVKVVICIVYVHLVFGSGGEGSTPNVHFHTYDLHDYETKFDTYDLHDYTINHNMSCFIKNFYDYVNVVGFH
jgi:hypothetical protein